MAQQAKQAAQRLGGMFPKGSGKGIGGAAGAIITLGALGYGINASLFNGNYGCAFFLVRKKKLLLNTLHYSRWWSPCYQVHSSFWRPKQDLQ